MAKKNSLREYAMRKKPQNETHPCLGDAEWWDYELLLTRRVKCVETVISRRSPQLSTGQCF